MSAEAWALAYNDEESISKSDYVKTVTESLQDLDLKIIFEPGRSIVGDCGILVSQVVYVKESSVKKFYNY